MKAILVLIVITLLFPMGNRANGGLWEEDGFMNFSQLYTIALNDEVRTGVPASLTVSQKIQESGWNFTPIYDYKTGKNSFNLFGIKWHTGEYVEALTWEYSNKWIKIIAKFQAYGSYEESVKDHTDLLTRDSYGRALAIYKKDKDLAKYVKSVCSVYATSPNYFDSIWALMKEVSAKMVKEVDSELEIAWKFCLDNKIFRPSGNLDIYRKQTFDKEEMAVVLKRLYDLIKST